MSSTKELLLIAIGWRYISLSLNFKTVIRVHSLIQLNSLVV